MVTALLHAALTRAGSGVRGLAVLLALAQPLAMPPPAGGADARLPAGQANVGGATIKTTMLGLYLTSLEAAEALAKYSDVLLVDVRPLAAVERDGLAAPTHKVVPLFVASTSSDIARHDAARAQINPRFISQIEALTGQGVEGRQRTIIVICPDGSHSAIAVDHLADHGYRSVYLIVDGATGSSESVPGAVGWRRHGLPWLAKPRPEQVDR